MTSFLIAYPDVPARAMTVTTSVAYDTDYPISSSFYGERWNYAQPAADTTVTTITYDLGVGNTQTAEYFLTGGVGSLRSASVTAAYLDGNNGSAWTGVLGTTTNFQNITFSGQRSADAIFTPTFNTDIAYSSTAYRYYRVTLSTTNSANRFSVSKLYFGGFLDMGKEPDFYDLEVLSEEADTWRYARGHILMTKTVVTRHRITVEWDGVTDAKAQEFMSKIVRRPQRNHVYLYTADSDKLDPLYDNQLVHCKLEAEQTSYEKKKGRADWNDCRAIFTELVG